MGGRYKFSVDLSVKNSGVTGNLCMISVHRKEGDVKFLVDCGMFMEDNRDALNAAKFDFKPENIDFMLATHIHADHTGRIPLLYKRGFYGVTYCSEDTANMMRYALTDNVKILGIVAKFLSTKPLYTERDVEYTLANVTSKPFYDTFEPVSGVKVTLFKNAHLIGAAMILVQISSEGEEDINLFFMGDYNKKNKFFDVPELPEWVKKLPLHVICESTYGAVDSFESKKPVFRDNIENWVNSGKKTIIIPTLSLGRYQEIAYILKTMQDSGKISTSIPIWFEGNLAIKYTNAFKNFLDISPTMRDFMPDSGNFVTDRAAVMASKEQKIIVTTSGGADFGPAPEYVSRFIGDPNACFHFTSYLWKDCLGKRILDTPLFGSVSVQNVLMTKRAEVKTTSEFSGHARRDEMARFLAKFKDLRVLYITHGEPEVRESFGRYCQENCRLKNVAITGTGYTFRMNTYGIIKSIYEKPMID